MSEKIQSLESVGWTTVDKTSGPVTILHRDGELAIVSEDGEVLVVAIKSAKGENHET